MCKKGLLVKMSVRYHTSGALAVKMCFRKSLLVVTERGVL